jgi:chromosome partitioning protein
VCFWGGGGGPGGHPPTPPPAPAQVYGPRVARVLAIANQKGGVGKTTTAVNLAAALVELGRRVLVVDLDAQGCATFWLGLDPEDLERSGTEIFGNPDIDPSELVLSTADGVDVLPATLGLAGAERSLANEPAREHVLKHALATLKDRYDWILLDCSPSLGIVTINAFTAADDVLIPLQCETLSHRGVGQLIETIADVQRLTNPNLRVLGVLPTLFDGRTTHARAVLNDLGPRYGVRVFDPITRSIRFAEAPAAGRSVLATDPTSRAANEYRALARVIESVR